MTVEDFSKPFFLNEVLVDPQNNQLTRQGTTVSAPHKLIQLLQFFAANPNRLISNQELCDTIWNGVVSEGTRYSQIANLRKLLQDHPSQPEFLKTVPRKGYIFIANVAPATQETPPASFTQLDSDHPPHSNRKMFWMMSLGILSVVLAVALMIPKPYSTLGFSGTTASLRNKHAFHHFNYSSFLQVPNVTFLINSYIDPSTPIEGQRLMHLGHRFISYQIHNQPDSHTVFAPLLNPAFKAEHLIEHYQTVETNTVQLIMTLADTVEGSQPQFNLTIQSSEKPTASFLIKLFGLNWTESNIQTLEHQIEQALKEYFQYTPFESFSFVANTSRQFINKASPPLLLELPLDQYEFNLNFDESVDDLWSIIAALKAHEPQVSFLHYYLLDYYLHFLYQWGHHYDFEQLWSEIQPINSAVLKQQPNHAIANAIDAFVTCIRDKPNCPNTSRGLVEKTQTLKTAVYLINQMMHLQFNLPLDLAQYTYQLNPIYGNSNFYFYYFYAALNELDFDSAQRVAEHYRFWENSSPIQIRKTLEDHKNFQHWYQGQAHPLLEHSADDVAQLRPNLDMTYMTFSLLDANQPDLAQRWLDNSGELRGQMEANPMIQLWTGQWKQHDWMPMSQIALKHINELQTHDQWRMAYLEIRADFPRNALPYFKTLVPEILADDYTLHINNIRLAVYLIEVLKGLNHQDQAQELIKKVDLYFQKNLSNIKRTVYFGLTDIQFFALNGQQAKAIQRLEQAILETKWLPNAFWMWPPLDKDPFLRNLQSLPRFQALAHHQQAALESFCYGDDCDTPTSPSKVD